ncbi:MAG: SH3 domain-containing protein [Anaerolineae bacterium]
MVAYKRPERKSDQRAPVRSPHQAAREQEVLVPEHPRFGGLNLYRLQRTIGNVAVVRLVQRNERSTDATTSFEDAASPLPPDLRRMALGLIDEGQRARSPDVVQIGQTFLTTGQLKVLSSRVGVTEKAQFLSRRIELLRREERVTVLDRDGSWLLVLTPTGKVGWLHSNRLVPRTIRMRPGETGSGTARGEHETAGRG